MTHIISTQIAQIESAARDYRDAARHHGKRVVTHAGQSLFNWCRFYEETEALYKAGAHHWRGQTWSDYCQRILDVSDSRIRQLRRVYPYAVRIANESGEWPSEWELRELPGIITPDDPHLTTKFLAAYRASGETAPDKAAYRAANAVVEDIVTTGGYVDNGDDEPVAFDAALTQDAYERMLRQRAHIEHNSRWQTVDRVEAYPAGLRQRLRSGLVRTRARVTGVTPAGGQSLLVIVRELKR